MKENFVFLVIFDTYDVMYNWPISLLPPIVLDNLFEMNIFKKNPPFLHTSMAFMNDLNYLSSF